ncbi:hypothetical protein GGR58DRAFT_522876 [Xylaria digitata]|nr:hypothetical protein GGR58DRAFT_522876 [Xylaria digitata]
MPPATPKGELSPKEKIIIAIVLKCFKPNGQIDWEAVADLGGYGNIGSAKNIYGTARGKLHLILSTAISEGRVVPKTTNRSATINSKGKRAARDADTDDGEEQPAQKKAKKTPVKSTPKKGKRVTPAEEVKAEEIEESITVEGEDDDEDEI